MRSRALVLLPIAAVLAVLVFPAGASADPPAGTIVVTTTADDDTATAGTCTLRDAISSANGQVAGGCASGSASGTTILVPAGTYFLDDGQLLIQSDVKILGGGARSTLISGSSGQRDIEISSGNVTIGGVTIENGSTTIAGNEPNAGVGGGIWIDDAGSLTLQDSTVTDNHADQSGGGIDSNGSLTVVRSTIENNQAGCGVVSCGFGIGGGIDHFGSSLSITNSTIMGNDAQGDGGGLYVGGPNTSLTNDTIANNLADQSGGTGVGGGGISVSNGNTADIANTLLAGNVWNGDAGNCSAGIVSLGGNLEDNSTCNLGAGDQSNATPDLGGVDSTGPTDVLPLQAGSPAIDKGNTMDCPQTDQDLVGRPLGSGCDIGAYEFVPSPARDYYVSTADELGGALAEVASAALPVQATIHLAAGHYDTGTLLGSVNFSSGPGLIVTLAGSGAGNTILDGDHLSSNVLSVGGSGLSTITGVTIENGSFDGINNNGDVALDDSVVQDNGHYGIESTNQGLVLSGSTISGNGSDGVYTEATNFSAINSTIADNNANGLEVDSSNATLQNVTIAGNLGDGIMGAGSVSVVNTIVANNHGADCDTPATSSNGHNLDKDGSCFANSGNSSDLPEEDPQLGPLQDNGGPTPTMALPSTSPAVDAGDDSGANCPADDQRGVTRPQGSHCDIGAFELVPNAESIAFESNRTGNSQIFTMNPDGTNVVQLTHDPSGTTDTLPSISPNGHTVVYQSDVTGVDQIWAINGDGTKPRQLTSVGSNQQPTFSPDGKKIAFDSDRSGFFQLFVMNADGSGQTHVMDTDGAVGGSSWSPDGSQIAFNEDTNGTNQIYTVDVASGTIAGPLTSVGANRNPHWSPDGSKILFVSSRCTSQAPFCGGGESVFLMDANGENQQNLTQAPIFDADPAWSPDGKHIAFVRDLSGQNFNVFTANPDGTNQVQLTFGSAPSRNSFPNWGTQVSGGVGTLSGSLSTNGQQNADLTSLGSQDWAVWGYAGNGTSASLVPDVRKAGGSGISDLTDIHQNGAPLRGLGQFASDLPFSFDWSDGTVPSSATGAGLGLQHDGQPGIVGSNGDGFSFTVPADTTQRTLTVYTTAHWATGTLTATLSDGSAQPFTQDLTGTSVPDAGNAPGIYTIDYAAANPGQHLTVNWVETAGTCPSFGCDNAAIYAVALGGPSSSATGASASFSSDPSVQMSGAVPISNIPLAAFDPQPPGAPPITIQNAQLGHTQLGQTQLGHTQLGHTQLGQTQLGHTQLGQTQLGHTQLGHTQLGHTQLGHTQLGQTQLGQTQLGHTQLGQTQLGHTQLAQTGLTLNLVPLEDPDYPNGWTDVLQGTSLAGQPLQTITLGDVYALTSPAGAVARIDGLTFADVDIPDSALGQITMDALTLGPSLINQLGGQLQSDIESQLHAWCASIESSGDTSFCDGPDPGIGYFSLMQLGLIGAPVDTLQLGQTQLGHTQLGQTQLGHTQLGQTQLGHTPLDDLSGSASGIVGMQLGHTDLSPGTGISGLLVSTLPTATQNALFDCSNPSNFDCTDPVNSTLANAQAAGAIKPGTLVGDLDVGDFFDGVTIEQLLDTIRGPNSAYQDTVTFGDVVGLLLRSTDVNWEGLSPDLLTVFDPNRHSLSMTAGFTVQGSGSPAADVKIDLPAGFDFVPGSAELIKGSSTAPLADPTITDSGSGPGIVLDWHLDAVDAGQQYEIKFGAYAGTTVGPTLATETVTAGGHSDSGVASFSVTDSFPGDNTAANATAIDTTPAHDTVEMSTLPTAGAVDYYTFPMPAAGTRISVHLTDLPADYDLALYATHSTSVRTTTPSLDPSAPPLQDGVVPDAQVNLNGGSSGQLTPVGLEDVPDPGLGLHLVQLSDNRHQDEEDVGMVSPGSSGPNDSITVAVFGYNGAFSPKAYTLRVRETAPPPTQICSARSFPYSDGTTPDSLPSLSSLPSNLNTIILVDEQRLGDTYGLNQAENANNQLGEQEALAKLHHLAGDSSLGVSGVVVPVETIPGVQSHYNTWDSNPCDPSSANAVANAIADEVDAIVAARPSVKYVVFGGGDDQIPFFRLPDLSLIANESGFTGLGANEYGASLAAGDLLSDDPYLDTHPIPASGQQLFPPNLAGGRLVETAQDIATAVTNFEGGPTPGALKSSTGFVSGYDFVADGSQSVATSLTAKGVQVRTLDNPLSASSNWGATAFLAAAFPSGGPADINSWNGHYDNYRAQMANGDILSTSQLPSGINGGVFFTMGCHAGFQTTDAVVGSSVLDWPQYFAQHDTGMVGNTGFGLGETDSVAFSEELMADFAQGLGGSSSLGQSLEQAKQRYYLSRVAFSNYDEKALSEAELYGLPMYGVGQAPRSLAALTPSPDPVNGASSSTSPSQGTLSPFPGTNVQSASFAATPHFESIPLTGQNGQYFTNAGQVQAPNYRPLQPYLSLPAQQPGVVAHGVVIDGLSSNDVTPFAPDNVRPTLNSSANEPPPSFTDEAWPEKIPALVSLGDQQNLNLITGQFFTETTGSGTTGVERQWTQIDGRVTYSNSQDFTPPTIDSIDAFQSNGVVAFSGQFSDRDQSGNPGTVAFAEVVYDDGLGHWTSLPLQHNTTSGLWSGAAPFSGGNIQYFVEACDAAGNCGYSSNKGRYFDAQPLPSGTGGGSLTITPSRPPDAAPTWYTQGLSVHATSNATAVSVSVDGGPFTSGFVPVAGDGAHVVDARDSDGNTATAVYLIDTTGPAMTHTITPAAPNGTNGWYTSQPTVKFFCTDNVSGVASCSGPTTLSQNASPQTVNGTSIDNAGNHGSDSLSGIKVDTNAPTNIAFSGIQAKLYPVNSLPPSNSISCTASDSVSGFHDCVVAGYSNAIGSHTLTATATDNAGNHSTSTLTYTVGFQAGNILAPVAAPSGDQTSPTAPDLQVFKIKSTVPLKFQFYLDSAKTTLMTTPPAGSTAFLTVAKYNGSTASTDQTDLVTGAADTGNQFRWSGGQYIYNMATSQLTAGTYYCVITLKASDGTILGQSVPQYFILRS
jgi:CSLREA domain-containing protein